MRFIFQGISAISTYTNFRLILLILLTSIGFTNFSSGQNDHTRNSEKEIYNQIQFRHDNDFFLLSDRYYTSGLYLSYGKKLKKGLFKSGNEQLMFSIGQEIITPTNTKSTEINDLDRPYVGFMGIKSGWSFAENSTNIEVDFLLGFAGKASGAGGFQRFYHNTFVVADAPKWVGEMNNSFHANLYVRYVYEWQIAPNPFSIHLAVNPEIAIGTRDIYFNPEIITYFGRRNSLASSIAYNRIGPTNREIFFSFRFGYRFVGHNALLEGNALGDNSIFLVTPNKTVLYGGFDFKHRFGQNNYWFGYRINSSESKNTELHKYIILSYARNF